METFQLISGYQDYAEYRRSFNELAGMVFNIDFEPWYQRGWWNDRYCCYSYLRDGRVVANVSVNRMELCVAGRACTAVQLGTVMTHPEYRSRGLAAELMHTVLQEYAGSVDFVYLFANPSAMEFYPKFGFTLREESSFVMDARHLTPRYAALRKLDITNPEDYDLVVRMTEKRTPVSTVLGVINDQHLLMFYCLSAFANHLYYLDDEDTLLIYARKDDTLHLYDVIGPRLPHLRRILSLIMQPGVTQIVFHFTPDGDDHEIASTPLRPCELFLLPATKLSLTTPFLFPAISHA